MKKILKIAVLFLMTIFLAFSGYSAVVIIKARSDTLQIVEKFQSTHNMLLDPDDLSQWQLRALLAVEDPNFYNHKGVDFSTPGAGLTTITQSLVKILYFDAFKPGFAKLKQSLIARFALDPLVSKNEQLRLYINSIYMGNQNGKNIYGFSDAAMSYFQKNFSKLSNDEYIAILSMIIAPNTFHPVKHPEAYRERIKRIKALLEGKYQPKSHMDIYYGPLDEEIQKGLAPASYFPDLYK